MNTSLRSPGENPRNTTTSGGAQKNHRVLAVEIFVALLVVIPSLVHLLRTDPPRLLRQELGGLGIVSCVLVCLGLYLWLMNRALTQDTRQAGSDATHDGEPVEPRK
jgi:hypothetical protein